MADKVMSASQVVEQIQDGDTVAIGGNGMARNPMALVRELVQSNVKDLTVIAGLGGPAVDLLIGAGKVKRIIFAYVGFDTLGLAPNFRRAKREGSLETLEGSEYMVMAGLEATIKRVPFMPVRSGLGSDLLKTNPTYCVFESPIGGEKLVAVPALKPDVALIHVSYADPSGFGQIFGDDYMDPLYLKAATKVFISAEKIVSSDEIERTSANTTVSRMWVHGVVEAPYGAHFTCCYPHYTYDLNHAEEYLALARSADSFQGYLERYVRGPKSDASYLARIGGVDRIKVV